MTSLPRLALTNIRHRKKRSWLTMIGIFIGIAAVVALVSLGQGLQGAIDESFEAIGSDKLFVSSSASLFGIGGGELADPLTVEDAEVIADVRGVAEVAAYNTRSVQVEVGEDVGFYFAAGIPLGEQYDLVRGATGLDIHQGRELREGDRNKVLVGFDYTRPEVFLEPVGVGDRIVVNGQKMEIVGVLEAVGSPPDDRAVWLSMDTFEQVIGSGDERDFIIARVATGEDPILIGEVVERDLREFRDLEEGEEDFNIQTPEDLLASFGTILTIVNVVLVGIAGISLLVGGIGIMNTMFTGVLERTREIGIMKATGASPKDIRRLFLFEAGLLGLLGGGIGIVIGALIAKSVEWIGGAALNSPFISAALPWWLLLGALLFSGCIGMLSGYFPARAAARLNPVEALRYE